MKHNRHFSKVYKSQRKSTNCPLENILEICTIDFLYVNSQREYVWRHYLRNYQKRFMKKFSNRIIVLINDSLNDQGKSSEIQFKFHGCVSEKIFVTEIATQKYLWMIVHESLVSLHYHIHTHKRNRVRDTKTKTEKERLEERMREREKAFINSEEWGNLKKILSLDSFNDLKKFRLIMNWMPSSN